jgi:uncharacterized protein
VHPAVPEKLAGCLESLGSVGVLLSGGADSEVLLRAAVDVLGPESVGAYTADSPLLAGHYRRAVRALARKLGVRHRFVVWDPLSVPGVRDNGPDRCYHCKRAIFSVLTEAVASDGLAAAADGTNTDDLDRHRPGNAAAEELGVRRPFLEAGMSEEDARRLGRSLGMGSPAPSDSCLATRLPEAEPLTRRELALVEELEAPLRPLVRSRFRVYLEGTRIMVHYRRADATAVSRMKEALKDRAREEGIRRVVFVMED